MTKREKFIQEFNALIKKYNAEVVVRERDWAMQTVADGIDIEFDYDEIEGIIPDICCGMRIGEIIPSEPQK